MKHAARLFLVSVLSCAASSVAAADAAADYPNRPIRFIAPFVAGGPSDMLSRLLGQRMSERWGQSVIVDNRGSAGGLVGFELGAKALPDGYTLLLANGAGLTINPHVYPSCRTIRARLPAHHAGYLRCVLHGDPAIGPGQIGTGIHCPRQGQAGAAQFRGDRNQ